MNKLVKYFSYILRHKWFVFVECFKHGLIWQGIIHDWSKFLPSEFFPYANHFFGKKSTATKKEDVPIRIGTEKFQIAWLHHQNRNPHHWQYWTSPRAKNAAIHEDGTSKVIDMPLKYRIEMVCDWIGAGRAQGFTQSNECRDWYLKNKNNMLLSENTRIWVEKYLNTRKFIENYKSKTIQENKYNDN